MGKGWNCLRKRLLTISRVGVLLDENTTRGRLHLSDYDTAARPLNVVLQSLEVQRQNEDFGGSISERGQRRRERYYHNKLMLLRCLTEKQIAELAIKNRMPSMHERNEDVEAGGLMSYAADDAESFKRAAYLCR